MGDMDELRGMFFAETDELLEVVAAGLRQMEDQTDDMETVHGVFRAVHSIKGGAAAFGLNELVTFAHRFEILLNQLRSDKLSNSTSLMAVMRRCSVCLADLVSAARHDRQADPHQSTSLLDEIDALLVPDDADDGAIDFVPLTISFGVEDEHPAVMRRLNVRFKPHADLYRSGNEPAALIRALGKLGQTSLTLDSGALSPLASWSADEPELSWQIELWTDEDAGEVKEVFDFVEDCCDLHIVEEAAPAPAC